MPKTNPTLQLSDYATVAERITLFYKSFPEGRIITRLISREDARLTFRAAVYRYASDASPAATGWASEREGDGDINVAACLENTETSAVGRALANLGFTASSRRPSREEMEKVARTMRAQAMPSKSASAPAPRERAIPAIHNDLLSLLRRAESLGFSRRRSAIVRAHVTSWNPIPQRQALLLERKLRGWVLRRTQAA